MSATGSILKWLRWLVLAVLSVYVVLGLAAAVIYFFVEPNNSAIELIKLFFEIGLWLAIPMLVISLLLRGWVMAIGAAVLAAIFGIVYAPLLIPRNPEVAARELTFTMMTFNLQTDVQGIAQIIRNADADIVTLQELSQESADAVRTLEDIYPHQALYPQDDANEGQGILSRYPILSHDYWEYPELPHTLGHMRVEIDLQGQAIVVYNTHPWPPLGWETGYNDESHREALQDIAERTFAETLPLLLAGDFNMTPVFGEYDLFNERFTDSYRESGDGLGFTYPNYKYEPFPPLLRLDYIWHSEHFQSVETRVWPEHGASDHSPVVAELIIR